MDVTGDCDTAYTIESSTAETTVIKKNKPSSKCSRTPTVVQSTLPEAMHKLPILSADQDCIQTITDGIIVKVECHEALMMRPLASSDDVATTIVNTKLTLRGKSTEIKSTGNVVQKTDTIIKYILYMKLFLNCRLLHRFRAQGCQHGLQFNEDTEEYPGNVDEYSSTFERAPQ